MLRVALFLGTNLAVLVLAGAVMSVLSAMGYNFGSGIVGNLIFCAIFGMAGSFISLAMSKWMAKRATGAHVITEPRNETEKWLVDTVKSQAERAGIGMPEVAIFGSREPNAFATGMFKNSSLIAVSEGLLQLMDREEVEAVLGHEIAHVANGDMVTLALIQGVVNTFVIFIARTVASQFKNGRFFIYMGLQMLLGFLASMIVAWFSRRREFRADEGGAELVSSAAMASALGKLQSLHEVPSEMPEQLAAFGIRSGGMSKLFSTHPPLEVRIAKLRGR